MDAAPSWHRPERRFWRRGRWQLELRGDELADITFDGRVVLRSIRAVVRDHDWNTAAWTVTVDEGEALALTLSTDGDLGCAVTGSLTARATDASLSVMFDATADSAFDTNRTGLVVLHPPALAGTDLTITHPDGTREHTAFPAAISPHQPAFEIAGLAWEHDGTQVAVEFSGEVFEMEDQRNWTDASYKTYSRPLSLPFPYRLEAGERVRQGITVSLETTDAVPAASADGDVLELTPGGLLPAIGLSAATARDPAPAVSPIGTFVLVELDLASPSWGAALQRASTSGLPLDVRFVLNPVDPDALGPAVAALAELPVARVAAFQPAGAARHVSDAAATEALRDAVVLAGLRTEIIGGARSHFTELNREIARIPDDLDGVVFSLTPLFHSRDTEQLIESLPVQRLVAEEAVRLAAGRPVHIGPVTLRPRFNDVATAPPTYPTEADLCHGYGAELLGATDARQGAPELAAWTIASAAALAVPGVSTLVFFEEWGPRGIRSADGTDLPVAGAVRALAQFSGAPLLTGASPDGLVWAIGATSDHDTAVLVANLDAVPRVVTVRSPDGVARVELQPGAWSRVALMP